MKNMADSLEDLFVEEEEALDLDALRSILVNYVKLSKEGGIFPLPGFETLSAEQKILTYLLAKKVLKLKINLDELTAPKEIQESVGLPKGTVNPKLTGLADRRLVQNVKGKYFIPNYAVNKVKELFLDKTK